MDLHRINIKLPAQIDFTDHEIVPIFHRWIQNQSLPDHLLIDVANYDHVHDGPGVALIASEANIHLDHAQGQAGLLYVRKRPIVGAAALSQRLRFVLDTARAAATKLEQEPELTGRVRFSIAEFWVQANDRLAAPNTDAAFDTLKAALLEALGNSVARVERVANAANELLKVRVDLAGSR